MENWIIARIIIARIYRQACPAWFAIRRIQLAPPGGVVKHSPGISEAIVRVANEMIEVDAAGRVRPDRGPCALVPRCNCLHFCCWDPAKPG